MEAVTWTEEILLLGRGEHREVDRQERVAIRPSKK